MFFNLNTFAFCFGVLAVASPYYNNGQLTSKAYSEFQSMCQYPTNRFIRESSFCVIRCHEKKIGQQFVLLNDAQSVNIPPLSMLCRGLVSKSPITHITSATFSDLLHHLYALEIQESVLPELNSSLLDSMQNLRNLRLSRNQIERVHRDAFIVLNKLKELDLSYNKILQLDAYLFRENPNLNRLNISGQPQLSLQPNHPHKRLLDGPIGERLQHIHLDYMNLTTVPTIFLSRLRSLKSLTLRGNKIDKLLFLTFYELPFTMAKNRIHYDFRDNIISYIESTAFLKHNVPLILDLRNNLIQKVSFLYSAPLSRCHWERSTINLHGNPIACDCAVYNFTIVKTNSAIILGVCSKPERYKNLMLYGWDASRSPGTPTVFFEQIAGKDCSPEKNDFKARRQFECRCNSWRRVDQEMDDKCMLQKRNYGKVNDEFILCSSSLNCNNASTKDLASYLLIGWTVLGTVLVNGLW